MPEDENDTAPAADQQAPVTAAADVPSQTAVAAPVEPPPSIATAPASPGQLAYEAYGEARGWKTATGGDMPRWNEQRPELCDAWQAAAAAVAAVCTPPPAPILEPAPVMSLRRMAAELHAALVSAVASEPGEHAAVARDQVAQVLETLKARDAFLDARGPR